MKTEKMKSFEEAIQPLFKWMEENCTPHDKVIVDTMNAELVSGEIGIPSEYNRKINNL